MTEKESIKIEKYLLDGYKKPNYKLAEKIMEVVEKQIQKKVKVEQFNRHNIYYCPTCDGCISDILGHIGYGFCSSCGQALDWSDTDEQNDR